MVAYSTRYGVIASNPTSMRCSTQHGSRGRDVEETVPWAGFATSAVSLLRGPPLDLRITETASTGEWRPSLITGLFTWVRTVAVLIPRRDAILVVEMPIVRALDDLHLPRRE
jgi:hypothetical protein